MTFWAQSVYPKDQLLCLSTHLGCQKKLIWRGLPPDPNTGIQKHKLGLKTDQNEQFSDQKIRNDGKIDEKVPQKGRTCLHKNEVEPHQNQTK